MTEAIMLVFTGLPLIPFLVAEEIPLPNEPRYSLDGLSMVIARPTVKKKAIGFDLMFFIPNNTKWAFQDYTIIQIECVDSMKKQSQITRILVETSPLISKGKMMEQILLDTPKFTPSYIKVGFGATDLVSGYIPLQRR